jgi:aryl-alcohol dehydrogenase-like predicted oxidoreductase
MEPETTDDTTSRLVLGTAQLGMPYGVANTHGRPSLQEAWAMLTLALDSGIRTLDTAAAYGEAEATIGRYLRERIGRVREPVGRDLREHSSPPPIAIVTKLTLGADADPSAVRAALAASRSRLGVAPAAVLLHDPSLLAHWRGPLGRALRECRAEGLVGAIGVSVYTPEQFAAALELPELDLVQAPFSVLDRRLEQTGLLAAAHARRVGVLLRSVFLQGLLTMQSAAHPAWLHFAAAPLRAWQETCTRHRVEPHRAALRFVLARTAPARVLVGCETQTQLRQLLTIACGPDLPRELTEELEQLASDDARLLDPRRWSA